MRRSILGLGLVAAIILVALTNIAPVRVVAMQQGRVMLDAQVNCTPESTDQAVCSGPATLELFAFLTETLLYRAAGEISISITIASRPGHVALFEVFWKWAGPEIDIVGSGRGFFHPDYLAKDYASFRLVIGGTITDATGVVWITPTTSLDLADLIGTPYHGGGTVSDPSWFETGRFNNFLMRVSIDLGPYSI